MAKRREARVQNIVPEHVLLTDEVSEQVSGVSALVRQYAKTAANWVLYKLSFAPNTRLTRRIPLLWFP